MKNVCEKKIKNYHIYKPQKFVKFHQNKKIKLMINRMIRIFKTIQIYDAIYLKKNNDRADALNKKNDHMKKKLKFSHNIFKLNKNQLLSANIKKLSAIIKIL